MRAQEQGPRGRVGAGEAADQVARRVGAHLQARRGHPFADEVVGARHRRRGEGPRETAFLLADLSQLATAAHHLRRVGGEKGEWAHGRRG